VYGERFAAKYGGVSARGSRPIVERSVKAFLKSGDLQQGFARVRCPDCHHPVVLGFLQRTTDNGQIAALICPR
jgi:hypothetical protein